jgi:proteasome alpha subunit
MLSPYDWQEGIGNRASYVEAKIAQGAPVLAVSLDSGILVMTYRRQSQKIFEIYDRLIFAAIGQQSDIEAIRVAAVEFAHREGYSRSESDVTIQRVVTAVSAPIKKGFGDFGSSPIVANSLFAELSDIPENDSFYTIEFDGDYHLHRGSAILAAKSFADAKVLEEIKPDLTAEAALALLTEKWKYVASEKGETELVMDGLHLEATLLERKSERENKFRVLA